MRFVLWVLLPFVVSGAEEEDEYNQRLEAEESETCNPKQNIGCEKYYKDDYPSPLQPGHKCVDFIKHERKDESSLLDLLTNDFEKDMQNWRRINRLLQSLYYIKGEKPGQEFVICTVPKTGITRVKVLLMRIAGISGGVHKKTNWKFVPFLNHDEKLRILTSPNITRIRLTRNPYIRTLSMYMDKVVQYNQLVQSWGFTNYPPSFDDWIDKYYERRRRGLLFDTHFSPQYDHCWGNLGFQFDYTLKVERQNYWYPCLMEQLNLWNHVMRGWDDGDHCYLSTPDVPCKGPSQDEEGRIVYLQDGGDGIPQHHNTGSQSRMHELYQNKTTAAKVTEIFLNDIVMYNYTFLNAML